MKGVRLLSGIRWGLFFSIWLHGLLVAALVLADREGWLSPSLYKQRDGLVAVTLIVNSTQTQVSHKLVHASPTSGSLTPVEGSGIALAAIASSRLPVRVYGSESRLLRTSEGMGLTPIKIMTKLTPAQVLLTNLREAATEPSHILKHRKVLAALVRANIKALSRANSSIVLTRSTNPAIEGPLLPTRDAISLLSRDMSVAYIAHLEVDLGYFRRPFSLETEAAVLAPATNNVDEKHKIRAEHLGTEQVQLRAFKRDDSLIDAGAVGTKDDLLVLYDPPPKYPKLAHWQRLQGRAVIEATVLESGLVGRLLLRATSGHRILDKAALDAIRLWRFSPPMHEGQPVQVLVRVPVHFLIDDPAS